MSTVHAIARVGFGTGTNDLYDRARPSYPSESLQILRETLSGEGPFNIVEVASGTGLFTRALLPHPVWQSNINKLVAIEPSPGMRDVFSRTIKDNRVSLHEGTFTDLSAVEDNWADVVVIAQAWHWADPDYDTREMARVLRPGGVLAFIWNLEDREAASWVDHLRTEYEVFEHDTPQFRLGWWKKTFDNASFKGAFDAPSYHHTQRSIPTTVSGVQDRVLSKSYIAALSPEEKEVLKSKVFQILDKADKVWISEEDGVFEYPYVTTLVTTSRKDMA